ncbi:DHH family protein [Treponema primitia ZAS-2]|uniref:DHH family protein n=1 Tax=Treponema primitia (strain ATCC BAA-887 / DSM 12427 / ZAS-2) TaxID=545694 RepID=F5YL88_TREPZ|nr:bifunctional oligoribonuclease/PAP phosphatase NrnA [Treponema primitia]AEF86109.1 DHH family protein [Treponema primitia ZAS-2]
MCQKIVDFINRNESFVLTTHDTPDADGIGAEIALAYVLKQLKKKVHIINASAVPEHFRFQDPRGISKVWDPEKHGDLPGKSVLIILDTSDEFHIGAMKDIIPRFQAFMVIDHHELNPHATMEGYIDPSAAATCQMVVEIATAFRITLDRESAVAAYAGLNYDSGSFAYSKTTARTFATAKTLVEAGVKPYEIYGELNESATTSSLLLQRQVMSTLELFCQGRVAVQILRKEDLNSTGARFEDAETFINIPLKSRDILVSILIKENSEGPVRCSLRSKGKVNVSKIAQQFSGGGHALAAGFRSDLNIEKTLEQVLGKVEAALELSEKPSAEKV